MRLRQEVFHNELVINFFPQGDSLFVTLQTFEFLDFLVEAYLRDRFIAVILAKIFEDEISFGNKLTCGQEQTYPLIKDLIEGDLSTFFQVFHHYTPDARKKR